MNKKLLSIVVAGLLTVPLLPGVVASAAEVNQSSVNVNSISNYGSWSDGFVYSGSKLYSDHYSDCYAFTLNENKPASIKRIDSNWYAVRLHDANGNLGSTYYVWGSSCVDY